MVVRSAGGLAATLGRLDESLALHRRAAGLEPLNAVAGMNLGTYAYDAGQFGEAVAASRKSLELNPAIPVIHHDSRASLPGTRATNETLAEIQQEPLRWLCTF
jgi:hypothetical protein